ncbi:MAG: hypothetical protein U0354_15040 [Candidatus Sericytochromatia bacterium]
MGFLDKFFKKKQEPEINYEEIIFKSWGMFKEGLQNPNPDIRRSVEETVWYIDSPEGKRFFAVGMQEPDIDNKSFCLLKLYERGGWRLAENIVKIAINEKEIPLSKREEMIYFIGGFSDPNATPFLLTTLQSDEEEIRIAGLCALSGVKNGEAIKPVYEHLNSVKSDLEKFACGLVLYQYNHQDGKKILDEILKNNKTAEFINKLQYLDFNKARAFIDDLLKENNSEIKISIIKMIEDNRGVDILKNSLKDSDSNVVIDALERIISNGSRSALEEIQKINPNNQTSKMIEYALASFNDKKSLENIEKRVKESKLDNETIEDLKIMGLVYEQDIAETIDKLLLPINNLDECNNETLDKIIDVEKLLIKYGKISSILILSKYLDMKYLQKEDIIRWKTSCYAAVAILCIVERNTTYYTLRKKIKEEQNLK